MNQKNKTAVIFGGTGFIGRQVVRELAKLGVMIKVATRIPEAAYFLRTCGNVGQIVPVVCDYNDPQSIQSVVRGCDYVVNTIGILYERGQSTFQKAHIDIPQAIAEACAREHVERFVHISALACERGTSKYAKSKYAGEGKVHEGFPKATILRPSIVFGPDDSFFNMFAEMSRFLPALPLIGGGHTKFQPVYVGDVADAVIVALTEYELGKYNPCGNIYELGGPDIVTFKQVFELLEKYTGRKRMLVSLPYSLAKAEAFFLQLLPKPLLTPDQVESLKTDNILNDKAMTLSDLGITATSMASILPEYLEHYRAGGRFSGKVEAREAA